MACIGIKIMEIVELTSQNVACIGDRGVNESKRGLYRHKNNGDCGVNESKCGLYRRSWSKRVKTWPVQA